MTQEGLTIERRRELIDVIANAIPEIMAVNESLSSREITSRLNVKGTIIDPREDFVPYVEAALRRLSVACSVERTGDSYTRII